MPSYRPLSRFVVPESPRWLLVKGRIDEVKQIVEAAAHFNKRDLPSDYETLLKPPPQEENSQDFFYLFKSRYLRRITICFLCIWFTMNLAYYGFILNMNTFGGNVYLNSVSELWQPQRTIPSAHSHSSIIRPAFIKHLLILFFFNYSHRNGENNFRFPRHEC